MTPLRHPMADQTPDPKATKLDAKWQATKIADDLARHARKLEPDVWRDYAVREIADAITAARNHR